MQVTLYMAPSIDGYIAKSDRDSEWVSPVCGEKFIKTIQEYGCIILGSTTFDQYHGELYPVKDVFNIVISSDKSRVGESKQVVFTDTPSGAVQAAASRDYSRILLIGGGTINGLFLKENLIDDIILDIHPLILGKGIKIFENIEKEVKLERTSINSMDDGLLEIKYRVIK